MGLRGLAFALGLVATSAAAVEIPFRWTPGQIEIEVSVNGGAPLWFILDTGAEYSIIDTELTKTLRLKPHARGAVELVDGVDLTVGPIALKKQTVMVLPLENFRRQKRAIRGLIGYDFFARRVVTIDFARKLLLIDVPPSKSATTLPLTFAGRLPVTTITFAPGDRAPLPAKVMIDTGASEILILRNPFASKHGLYEIASDPVTRGVVASNSVTFVRMPGREITLAHWKFTTPFSIGAYRHATGAGGGTDTDGLIGNKLLEHFRVTFDYARKRMLLEKYH